MLHELENQNEGCVRRLKLGCFSTAIIFLFLITGSLLYALDQEREAARYPGSILLSEHNNYSGFPYMFRWDNSYQTNDTVNKVYNWYSITFDMGAESKANGSCIYLEDSFVRLRIQRTMSVFICGTKDGQLIYVSRSTALLR